MSFYNSFALTIVVLLVCSVVACNSKIKTADRDLAKVPKADSLLNIPESYFKFTNIKEVNIEKEEYDRENMDYKLSKLNNSQRTSWTDKIYPINKVKPAYQAYFYSKQFANNNLVSLIILVSADDYDGMLLINVSPEGKLLNYQEIAGGICSDEAPDPETGDVFFCDKKITRFIGEQRFRTFITRAKQINSQLIKDSLIYDYQTQPSGDFKLLQKDSLHIE